MSTYVVRPAETLEFERLQIVDLRAEELFEKIGIGPFPPGDLPTDLLRAAVVYAAGEPAVGFISVEVVDGDAHIGQLSVLPECGGQGVGRALLDQAIRWARRDGRAGVTLTTFRDVAWNAPFYRRVGFEVVDQPGPELAARRAHERAAGIDRWGPRLAMRLELTTGG